VAQLKKAVNDKNPQENNPQNRYKRGEINSVRREKPPDRLQNGLRNPLQEMDSRMETVDNAKDNEPRHDDINKNQENDQLKNDVENSGRRY
jgi:hypothetical protein